MFFFFFFSTPPFPPHVSVLWFPFLSICASSVKRWFARVRLTYCLEWPDEGGDGGGGGESQERKKKREEAGKEDRGKEGGRNDVAVSLCCAQCVNCRVQQALHGLYLRMRLMKDLSVATAFTKYNQRLISARWAPLLTFHTDTVTSTHTNKHTRGAATVLPAVTKPRKFCI